MLGRLINTVTHLRGASHLDWCVINPYRINRSAAQTRDEANRDDAQAIRFAPPWGCF